MEKSICTIQAFFRKWLQKKYPLYNLCSNFWDKDLISLENIRELKHNEVFFLTSKTGHFFACDAVAWLGYFIQKYTYHPMTREKISPDDVWQCYLCAKQILPANHEYIEKCKSKNLTGQIDENLITIKPTNPLVRINLIECDNKSTKKKIIYTLSDSRNSNIVFTTPLTVNFETDKKISFTF